MMTTQDKRDERKLLTKWKTTKSSDRIPVKDQFEAYHQWWMDQAIQPPIHVFPNSVAENYFKQCKITTIPIDNARDYK